MSYKHLSLEERYYIEIELREGTSINAIAKALGRPQGKPYLKRYNVTEERRATDISKHIPLLLSVVVQKQNRTSLQRQYTKK